MKFIIREGKSKKMKGKIKIDDYEFIVNQKVIGLICEDEKSYNFILRPKTKISETVKKQR